LLINIVKHEITFGKNKGCSFKTQMSMQNYTKSYPVSKRQSSGKILLNLPFGQFCRDWNLR